MEPSGDVGFYPSIAVDTNGDPVISFWDRGNRDLMFAICDISASTNGNCDQQGDWNVETLDGAGVPDVGAYTSIAVDADGNPLISYMASTGGDLRFATASPSATPVGGIAELPELVPAPIAKSESPAHGAAVLAALSGGGVLLLTAGAWYVRRRRLSRRA